MAENGYSVPKELTPTSKQLIDALSTRKDLITWANKAIQAYQAIKNTYDAFSSAPNPPEQVSELCKKVIALEHFMTVDLERHIAILNGRAPYYLDRIPSHLRRAVDLLRGCSVQQNGSGGTAYQCSRADARELDHLAAEFQSSFNEYGFCQVFEAIYDVDEATQKLEALSLKLSNVEKTVQSGNNNEDQSDISSALMELHNVVAGQNGMQQAMTEANISKMKVKFDKIGQRICKVEEAISGNNIKSDSQLFIRYLASQHLLNRPFVKSVVKCNTSEVINDHMIHPGTRGWILERFQKWLYSTKKRLFFLAGKEGSGKTAMSSAICKLHSHSAVASHFCVDSRSAAENQLNTMIQSIASDLFLTVPEYLNWMDDKYSNEDLAPKLSVSWQQSYTTLLKEPLQALYGASSSSSTNAKRRVIIIDGMNKVCQAELNDVKPFLGMLMKDLPGCFTVFVTVRTDDFSKLIPVDYETTEGIGLEDKAWTNRHIKDIEIYLSTSLGAILSGEDKTGMPFHAKADESTLQNAADELIKHSGGRFDYAIELMEMFSAEMVKSSGQFLSSLKKVLAPFRERHGNVMEENMREFSSPFRSYRDREGRSVNVRVMRQSHYLMDKTRSALIRGRHKIHQL